MTSAISPGNHHILYNDPNPEKWQGDPNLSITGSGFAVPRGIEAILSYNGLVMNDLTVYDKYRVLSIDGLADADVRDNREELPGDDGESAYDNFYGGRTIVLKVRVEAYELNKLRDMEEALRTAFSTMVNNPLYFLTGDPEKDHYISCKKSASLTKEEDVSNINFKHFREWQITLRASDPRFYRVKKKFLTTLVNNYYQTDEVNLINIGNYNTKPIITLQGAMSNIKIINDNANEPFNNITFKDSVSISDGNYYVIDIEKRIVIDQNGNNKINDLDKSSGWLKLYPGSNRVYLDPSTTLSSSNAQFSFSWKDAWI